MRTDHSRERSSYTATKIYEAARDLLFLQDLDASVLRFSLDGVSHVAVLGEEPLDADSSATVEQILDETGEYAEIPEMAGDQLRARRRAFKSSGVDYFERRTRRATTPPPST